MRKDEMLEDSFYENLAERILEHYKDNQTLSRTRFIEIIREENQKFIIRDIGTDIYGELEIESRHPSHSSPANDPRL